MLRIPEHRRDILDIRAEARRLNLVNRHEAPDAPLVSAPAVSLDIAVETDRWYHQRPRGWGGGRPDNLTGTAQ